MRMIIALPLLLVAGCNVSQDDGNGTTSISFDQNAAENTLDTVGAHAENIGGEIVNDVKETSGQVQNQVGDVDVDVDANASHDNASH